MNNLTSANDAIPVYGKDAEIVHKAQVALAAAAERTDQAAKEGKVYPMTFFDKETEKPALDAYQDLQKKVQEERQLACRPHLFAAPAPLPAPQAMIVQNPPVQFQPYNPPRLTDMDLAAIFLQKVLLRRVGQTIYCYNGAFYQKMTDEELKTLILDKMRTELRPKGNSAQLKNILEFVKAEPDIEVTQPNAFKRHLCLRNGLLDMSTFTLYPHSPNYFVTWQMQTEWVPDSTCPVCDQFVYQIAGGDPLLIKRIWEAIGFILASFYVAAKRFVLLQGQGDTGKSLLGNLLRSFYAPQDVGGLDAFLFGKRFSNGYLADKRVNLSMDLNDARLDGDNVSTIKGISGGDLMPIENKYGHMYSGVIACALVFGTNHTLRTVSQDGAFWDRVLLIPFCFPVPRERQDHNLLTKLVAERPGILHKAFVSYREVVTNYFIFTGDDRYDIRRTVQVGDQTADELEDLKNFINLHCSVVPGSFTPTDLIHSYYLQYCRSLQHEGIQNGQKFSARFKHLLESDPRFASVVNKKQRYGGTPLNGYVGIAFQ